MSDSFKLADTLLERLAEALAGPGFLVLDAVLPTPLVQDLQRACREEHQTGFRPAATGRDRLRHIDPGIRSDVIRWLGPDTAAETAYLAFMETVRSGLNSRLLLGLFDYECHYARYAPGAAYQTHLDAFTGSKSRVLSTVFYLNEGWTNADGGELLLYDPEDGQLLQRVLPVGNRMVVFLSERFPHEVRPALRERCSMAGWFRVKEEKSWLRPV